MYTQRLTDSSSNEIVQGLSSPHRCSNTAPPPQGAQTERQLDEHPYGEGAEGFLIV